MERYLIDTNVYIEMSKKKNFLNDDVLRIFYDYETQLYISVESVKELIHLYNTKDNIRKLWRSKEQMLDDITNKYNIRILDFTADVLEIYAQMDTPNNKLHNDPTDHIIVAQALLLDIPLISSDGKFDFYKRQGLDVIYSI